MDEKDWLILKTLFEKKSITQTAATLFISQPALSSRLQQIEARFGTTIVVRGKKGVQFTLEGEFLVKNACEMLKRIQYIEESLQDMRGEPVGTLRIGASAFFTKYLLPELLRRFKLQYPRIEFKVTTGWSRDIVKLANGNDIHIGFIRGDYDWSGKKVLLFEEKMYVSYIRPVSLIDLPKIPRIDYRNDYSVQQLLDKWWNEKFSVGPYIGMEVDRVDTGKEMVSKGLGYAFLPGTILANCCHLSSYEMIYKSGSPLTRKTWMLCNQETMDLKLVKAFSVFVQSMDFMAL